MNGIDYYDERPGLSGPTLSEVLAGLTTQQKNGVLDAYAHRPKRRSLTWVKHNLGVRKDVTALLYVKIEEIEQAMKRVMTDNWEGVAAPESSDALNAFVKQRFSSANTDDPNDFNNGQCDAVVAKVVSVSKYGGGANFTWYKDNVSL